MQRGPLGPFLHATEEGRSVTSQVLTLVDRFEQLTEHRQGHIMRVVSVMEELARRHRLDVELSRWAGFGHDLAREFRRPNLTLEAERLGVPIREAERKEPLLLHGPIAAKWLEEAGVGDGSVWQAIRLHTTAGAGMTRMAKALFVADAVEPGRSYAHRPQLFELALEDLEQGYRAVLQDTWTYTLSRHLSLHPNTVQAMMEIQAQG